MRCKHCGGRGIPRRYRRGTCQYRCAECHGYFTVTKEEVAIGNNTTTQKVLCLDIETLPLEVYTFGIFDQRISPEQVKKDWSVSCWSAKWLFDSKYMGEVVEPREAIVRQDRRIMKGIWKLLDEADIVITQNGNGFDLKRLNTRFLLAGLKPPMYYQSIDTLAVLRKNFDFTSNALDFVDNLLGIDHKIETTFEWWKQCAEGNHEYLKKTFEYCKHDVGTTEELYLKLRPWIRSHPNIGLFVETDDPVCRNCGSIRLDWKGQYATPLNLYDAFRCSSCGALGRGRVSMLEKDKQRSLTAG